MKISIITINRNNAPGLLKTIESVINQTAFNQIEYIIIDGDSIDESKKVIEEFADKLDFWVSEPDKGIYNAMNKGISVATGDYCQFLNSGDVLATLSSTEKFINNLPSAPIITGNMIKKTSNGIFARDNKFRNGEISFLTFYLATINHSSTYIHRDLFLEYGLYDETLKIVSDWKWFLQVVGLNNIKVIYQDIDLTVFDMSGISNTNPVLERNERRKVLEELLPASILKDYDENAYFILKADRLKKYNILWHLIGLLERIIFKIEKILARND